jgi:transcriptional regulator with XRE-family HTH domain
MASPPEPQVGQHIRALREQQGLSLRALAERSGLSVNAISMIERGVNSPTVSSLQLLATALGVPITAFFEDHRDQSVVATLAASRLRTQANGITMESLGIGLHDQQLEPFLITLEPGAGNHAEPVNHAGEEFVHCLEGEINYCVGDRLCRLAPGDSLLFQASQSHSFHNPGHAVARMVIVFTAVHSSQLVRQLHLHSLAMELQ